MKYFLALVPPAHIAQQIEDFRAAWGPASTPPHITIKAPNSLGEPSQWLPQVVNHCKQVVPIRTRLAGVGQFGTATVYLRAESLGAVALHNALLDIIDPPLAERAAYFEGAAYLPHLTLAHTGEGLSAPALANLFSTAAVWTQPLVFESNELIAFRSLGAGVPYELYQRIPLLGLKGADEVG